MGHMERPPSFTGVVHVTAAPSQRCFATGSGEWVDADPTGCDGEEAAGHLPLGGLAAVPR